MAAILAGNNVEEEYLWSCTLSGTNKEHIWDPKEPEDFKGEVKPGHRLLIKTAILMPDAKKDEITIVQIESEGYNKKQVTLPIVAMKGGSDLQKYVDLLIPAFPATIKIIEGSGPLHLAGSHCVDYSNGGREEDESDDDGDEELSLMEQDEPSESKPEGEEDKKASPGKEVKKATPVKEDEKASPGKEEKKATPGKEEKKATPGREDKKATPGKDKTDEAKKESPMKE